MLLLPLTQRMTHYHDFKVSGATVGLVFPRPFDQRFLVYLFQDVLRRLHHPLVSQPVFSGRVQGEGLPLRVEIRQDILKK